METYLLKFSACLFVLWLVYVLFFERQNMHRFKRLYLLVAIASALIIPTLAVTHYIEPVVTDLEVLPVFMPLESSITEIPQKQLPFLDLETVLWIIYGLGVLLFALRFMVNLFKMYQHVASNKTITHRPFIYVLLEECKIPHSFFKYLFFEKYTYEMGSIPNEVKLHEETHAKQLHSLDIIAIELLQIVFWFHPLIYMLKHHIKLNHEFLADQAVIKKGVDTKAYQNLLLQFSSNTDEYQLSSAINYSSIKKRFTVMKTQTSKTRIWISSLLLLPIVAILFYSFAEKQYVEKATLPPSKSINNHYARSIDLKVLKDGSYLIDGIKATKLTFTGVFNKLHQDITPEVRNNIMNIHVTSSKDISNKETWFIYNALQDYGFYRIVTPNQDINRAKGNTPFAIEGSLLTQEKVTAKQVTAYNAWAKKIHSESKALSEDAIWYPPIDEEDLIKFSKIYKKMSAQQKKQAVDYPFPGLDVKDSDEKISISSKTKQQIATKKQIAAYNVWAKKLNNTDIGDVIIKKKELAKYKYIYSLMTREQKKNAEPFPQIPPPPPSPVVKKGEASNIPPPPPPAPKVKKGEISNIPPPPPPAPVSTLDFVIKMAKANAKFFNEGKAITSDKAIDLIKKNDKLNINAQKTDTKQPLVYITKKPIRIGKKGKS